MHFSLLLMIITFLNVKILPVSMACYGNAAGSYSSHSKMPLAAFNKLCILSPFFGGAYSQL
jgi:hypothetical protein